MPKYYVSTRSYNLGSHTPGRARGGTLEEPTAGNLHGGVREGRELTEPRLTYTRTKLETADRAKEDLKSRWFSSTRNRDVTPTGLYFSRRDAQGCTHRPFVFPPSSRSHLIKVAKYQSSGAVTLMPVCSTISRTN